MAERTQFPSSPACGKWETLLTDALDGLLRPEDEAEFSAHMAVCPACAALFEEARKGREWLEFLSPEPEAPEGLFEKILAQTGPGQIAGYGLMAGNGAMALPVQPPPAWQRPGLYGFVRRFAEPRLLMTAAMAFFSIALTLNLTGVRLSNLRLADLRPRTVRSYVERQLTTASVPIIRYYDHLRFVYELESRMRQLRGNPEDEQNQQQDQPQPGAPGESRKAPAHGDGGFRVNPPQAPKVPEFYESDYLETSLKLHHRSAHSGGSANASRERSTVWTA